jgi:hypothetical protein
MSVPRTTLWWVAAACVAAASLAWRFVPLPEAAPRFGAFHAGTGQRLQAMELAPWEREFFGAARAVRWLAADRTDAVVVTAVDGTGNRRAVHDPSFCFRGAGWTIAATDPLRLPHGEGARVTLRRGAEELEAVYWFSDAAQAHASPPRYWWDTTRRRLSFGASGPEPILVLLVPARGARLDWESWLRRWPGVTHL